MIRSDKRVSLEELRYAKVLDIGVKIGFVLLVLSFAAYVTGILPPLVPFDRLPEYWGLSAKEFAAATNMPSGWGWVRLIGKGDILTLASIAFLAGLSVVCSLAVLPIFRRRRDIVYLLITVLQIAVLVFAASNILPVGW
jgi:hypothetical protein